MLVNWLDIIAKQAAKRADNAIPPLQSISPTPLPNQLNGPLPVAPQQSQQPNVSMQQTNKQQPIWKPSPVASIMQEKGDPNAWLMNLFTNKSVKAGCINHLAKLAADLPLAGPKPPPTSPATLPGFDKTLKPVLDYPTNNNPVQMPGRNYVQEKSFADFAARTPGTPALQDWLHGDNGQQSASAIVGSGIMQRMPAVYGNDPTAWKMFNEQLGNKKVPLYRDQSADGRAFMALTQRGNQLSSQMFVPERPNRTTRPEGLSALHEYEHYGQARPNSSLPSSSFREITPSLADVPRYMEFYDRYRQDNPGAKLKEIRRNVEGTNSMTPIVAPSGVKQDPKVMQEQAKQYGLFSGKSMAELLNTPSGRAYYQRLATGANPQGAPQTEIGTQVPEQANPPQSVAQPLLPTQATQPEMTQAQPQAAVPKPAARPKAPPVRPAVRPTPKPKGKGGF